MYERMYVDTRGTHAIIAADLFLKIVLGVDVVLVPNFRLENRASFRISGEKLSERMTRKCVRSTCGGENT